MMDEAATALDPMIRTAARKGSQRHSEEAPPRRLGRVLSSQQFWDLMERWRVPDAIALELIEFPGKLGKARQATAVQVHHAPAADHVLPA